MKRDGLAYGVAVFAVGGVVVWLWLLMSEVGGWKCRREVEATFSLYSSQVHKFLRAKNAKP